MSMPTHYFTPEAAYYYQKWQELIKIAHQQNEMGMLTDAFSCAAMISNAKYVEALALKR